MTPIVLVVILGLLGLVLTLHTRAVVAGAAEDAVRVAAAYGGDTAAGERRLRELLARELRGDVVLGTTWAATLDLLTLRVRVRVPTLGQLMTSSMTVDASAWHEAWP